MMKVCWSMSYSSISKALGTRSRLSKARSAAARRSAVALRPLRAGRGHDVEGLLVDVVLLDVEVPGNSQPPLEGEVGCGRAERGGSTPAASGTRSLMPTGHARTTTYTALRKEPT